MVKLMFNLLMTNKQQTISTPLLTVSTRKSITHNLTGFLTFQPHQTMQISHILTMHPSDHVDILPLIDFCDLMLGGSAGTEEEEFLI